MTSKSNRGFAHTIPNFWTRLPVLPIALLIWITPVLLGLATRVWVTDQGSVGPVICATGAWLLIWEAREARLQPRPGNWLRVIAALLVCQTLYIFSFAIDFLAGEFLAVYFGTLAIFLGFYGVPAAARIWFPLTYLGFMLPLPFFITSPVTEFLKQWISSMAITWLSICGIEAAAHGSQMFVDQYQVSVEATCAGLNSLVSLLALGCFYIHVRPRRRPARGIPLVLLIAPIAIFANLVRVIALLTGVHMFGVGMLGTPLHMIVGLIMSLVAMGLLIALDSLRLGRRT